MLLKTPKCRKLSFSLASDDPFGIRLTEMEHVPWQMIGIPRYFVDEALAMPILKRMGVYLLLRDEYEDKLGMYIGKGRLDSELLVKHHSMRRIGNDWCSAIAIVDKNNGWGAGHVAYLAWELTQRVKSSDRYVLDNKVTIKKPSVVEAVVSEGGSCFDTADMLFKLMQLQNRYR